MRLFIFEYAAASRQSTTATAAPRVARFSTSEAALAAEAHQAIPSARTDEEALGMYLDLYLARSMETTRGLLHTRVSEYTADQILWLKAQKADAKLAEVLPPFAAFPIFVAQAMEMTNGKVCILVYIFLQIQIFYYSCTTYFIMKL